MEVVLERIGRSTVLVVPPSILKALEISAGQRLTLEITADRKIALTPKRKFNLADMIAQCDLKAPPLKDLARWDALRPVGREAL